MDSVDQQNRWATAAFGECDAALPPLEAALFAADKVGEVIDSLAREGVVGSSSAEQRAAGKQNLSPRCVPFFQVFSIVHQVPREGRIQGKKKESAVTLRVTAPGVLRTG